MGIWVALAILSLAFFAIHANFAQDDAYITYRYARNIASGLGFVYNVGEPVLGTTTPLFTLLLAAGAYLTKADVTQVSLAISFVSLWLSAGILYQLGQAHSRELALISTLLYVTNPFLSHFVGMESYLLLFLLLATLWLYSLRKLTWTALSAGLLLLVRYEMAYLLGLILLIECYRTRAFPAWSWPGVLLAAGWGSFALFTFGSPIPLSASAKLVAPRIPFPVGAVVYWYSFVERVRASLAVIILFLLGVGAIIAMREFPSGYRMLYVFSLIYGGLASVFAGSFPWYYAPLVPCIAVTVAKGIEFLFHPWQDSSHEQVTVIQRFGSAMRWGCVVAVLGVQLLFWYKSHYDYQGRAFDNRYVPYRQVADWLIANASPQQSIASFEIGYIGYFTNMRVIDLAGLVTPGLYPWVAEGSEETLFHSLRLYSPDFVLIPTHGERQRAIMENDPRYRLTAVFEDRYLLYKLYKPEAAP